MKEMHRNHQIKSSSTLIS